VQVWRSYLVCGVPAEYFHRGDEQFWRDRWGAVGEDSFLKAVRSEPATSNGVWASKMMWNYFADADVLAAVFPGLRYIWLRRDDKLRQAISWWRAAAAGEFVLGPEDLAGQPPAFDRGAIGRLVRYAHECEEGWREWFPAHGITPLEIEYEELARDPDKAMRDVAAFLEVRLPAGLEPIRPRMRRQADRHTEEFVALFRREA
jgi:LPS sulfotransferase NodH